MNKLWLLPLALATTPALAQSCVLTGTIKGIGATPVIFRYTQQGKLHRDTVRAVNDRFTYTARPSDDGQIGLFIKAPRYTYFWYEPGKLTVTGDAAQPTLLTITGTPENDILNAYNHTIDWHYSAKIKVLDAEGRRLREQERPLALQFIAQHPAARTSAYLLYWQSLYKEETLADYERLLKQLTPRVQQSYQGQEVAKRLLTLRNQPTVGRPVPNFSLADTSGTSFALAAHRGRYVLLDFWGHWCGPCIQAMPKLNALHAHYAQQLAIIGIAMEGKEDAPAWKWAIRKYAVPGVQLSELQADKGPVMTGYNVTAFPTYMLLDRQGVLLLKTTAITDIEKKLLTLADL